MAWIGWLNNQKAAGTVAGYIDTVQAQAQSAYSAAIGILNGLGEYANFDPISVDVGWDAIPIIGRDYVMPPFPTAPTLDPMNPPGISFEYTEIPYVSSLLDNLKAKLLYDILYGGTGLSEAVENAMYDREKERDQRALDDTVDRIATRWSESGFVLPDGILTAMTSWADIEYQNKLSDKSRKIEEDSFKIAVDHQHFVLTESSKLEDVLMRMNASTNKNKIDAATAILEAGIKIFDALVKAQLAKVDLYKGEAQAYAAAADAIASISKADTAIIEARVAYNTARANVALKQIEMAIKQMEVQLSIAATIAQSVAEVASRLAAGALSAINAGVSMGYSGNDSNNSGNSSSISESVNFAYGTTTQHQHSTAINQNTNTSTNYNYTHYYYYDMG